MKQGTPARLPVILQVMAEVLESIWLNLGRPIDIPLTSVRASTTVSPSLMRSIGRHGSNYSLTSLIRGRAVRLNGLEDSRLSDLTACIEPLVSGNRIQLGQAREFDLRPSCPVDA